MWLRDLRILEDAVHTANKIRNRIVFLNSKD